MAALDSTADACPGRRRVAVTHLREGHELFIGSDELEARGKDDRLRVLRGKRGQEAPEVGEHAGESYHMVRKAAAVACNCPSKATVGAQHTEGGEDLVHLPRWKEKERMHESSHLRGVGNPAVALPFAGSEVAVTHVLDLEKVHSVTQHG